MAKKAREDVIKTTLEVDGEREYRQACKEINAVLRELGSELKLAAAEYADNADSTEALTAKQKILSEQLEQQKKKVDAAEKALKDMAEAGVDNEDAARKLRIELNKAKTAYADTERAVNKLSDEMDSSDEEYKTYAKAAEDVDSTLEELESELKLLGKEMQGNEDNAESMRKKHETLQKVLVEQQKKVNALERAYAAAAKDGDTLGKEASSLKTALNNAKSSIVDTESEINRLEKAMMNAADEVDGAEKEFGGLGDALEGLGGPFGEAGDMLNGLSEKLSGFGIDVSRFVTPATIGFAGVAAAIGSVAVESVKFAAETDKALVKFSNQTGIALEESEEFRDVMLDIYSDNIGESVEDIAAAMAAVAQATGDTNPEKLNDLTAAALTLRDTFDMDVQESIRSAQQLMNVFGATGESAYDTMAKAAQLGLNKDGNLLDIINEYAIHYSQLGISMDDMFDALINAKEAGVFDLTYAGEAIKEFGIRVREGGDEVKSALTTLGLDADEMVKKFNEGGPEARDALGLVVGALNGIDDATVRNQAGVALFGTAWEDLGATGVTAATNFNDKLTETEGTIAKINEADLSTIEGSWANVSRSFDANVKQPLGEWVETWLPEWLNSVAEIFDGFGEKRNTITFERFYDTTQDAIETVIVDGVEMVQAQGPTLGDELLLVPLRAFEENAPQLEDSFLGELETLNASAVEQVGTDAPEIGQGMAKGEKTGYEEEFPNTEQAVLDAMSDMTDNATSQVEEDAPTLGELLAQKPKEAYEANAPELEAAILDSLGKINSEADTVVQNKSPLIGQSWALGVQNAVYDGAPNVNEAVESTLSESVVLGDGIMSSGGTDIGSTFDLNFVSGMDANAWKIEQAVQGLMNGTVDTGESFEPQFVSIGSNSALGIWSGFSSQKGYLENRLRSMMRDLVKVVESEMDINSPSRVFARIGAFMAEGLGNGFSDEMRSVESQISKATASVVPNISDGSNADNSLISRDINIVQHIHAEQTNYAQQQRLAAKNFRMIAREL